MFPRRRLFRANPLAAEQLAILVQANQLLAQGRPLEAAPRFAQVAQAMQSSGHPRRAANLYARAAHAYADGDDGANALANAKEALQLFNQANMPSRLATFYANITRKMSSHGMTTAVDELERGYGSRMAPPAVPPHRLHAVLPTNCPKCGAPVHTEDATWVDENTLECEYCGALIRSE